MNPWIWAIASVVVAVLELMVPGFYLIWIAGGGAITALASFALDLSLSAQISIFVASCAVTCICGYFAYRRLMASTPDTTVLNQRGLEMVGSRGKVVGALTSGHGKVELGDSVWLAEGPDMDPGTPVVVTNVRGTVVTVVPL